MDEFDHTQLFSAEQIKIAPNLPGILKEYAKAVIREQPENIYEFSKRYFSEKVENPEMQNATFITVKNIKDLFGKVMVEGGPEFSVGAVRIACNSAGFPEGVVEQLLILAKTWDEFMLAGCALIANDFLGSISFLFEVYGKSIAVDKFVGLLDFLIKRDPEIKGEFFELLKKELGKVKTISYEDFKASKAVKAM